MSRLHSTLVRSYAEHYARLNARIDPCAWSTPQDLAGMEVNYREFIAPLRAGSKVLDLGCGTGLLVNWLSRHRGIVPVGVDASPTQIEIAQRSLPGVEISCCDGLKYLREHPQTFSGIICTDVLEHIPGEDLCLEWVEAARAALLTGGFFYCRMPNAANLTGSYSRYLDLTHQRSFTSASVIQLLHAGGLENCRIVPLRAPDLGGRLRLAMESLLHRIVFRICGQGLERIFTNNVHAIGYCL